MKKITFLIIVLSILSSINAQVYHETFDGNSLGWTEITYNNYPDAQYVCIDKGVLTVRSVKEGSEAKYTESFCYAPLDVERNFSIKLHLKTSSKNCAWGIRFNEKDDGNYYCFHFMEWEKLVQFYRGENYQYVGGITQGFNFPKLKKDEWYEMIITKEGNQISLSVQGIPIFNIKYMPMTYAGFAIYAHGRQVVTVDDIDFIQ